MSSVRYSARRAKASYSLCALVGATASVEDPAELRAVHLGHAEQFADDGEGQRVGEGIHEVGAPLREHRVEQFVGDLPDPRAQFLHPGAS